MVRERIDGTVTRQVSSRAPAATRRPFSAWSAPVGGIYQDSLARAPRLSAPWIVVKGCPPHDAPRATPCGRRPRVAKPSRAEAPFLETWANMRAAVERARGRAKHDGPRAFAWAVALHEPILCAAGAPVGALARQCSVVGGHLGLPGGFKTLKKWPRQDPLLAKKPAQMELRKLLQNRLLRNSLAKPLGSYVGWKWERRPLARSGRPPLG